MQRVSSYLPAAEQPIFYDGSILAEMLPSEIGIDIPILRVVFPERVFFDTGSATLKPAAMEIASIIAESLRHEPPDVVMFVAGHADARAGRAYNAALSVNRANALAEAVLDRGVSVASVWRVGFGEDLPLVAGDSEWAYGQNRRIEFLFAARPEALAVWLSGPQKTVLCQGRTLRETETCRAALDYQRDYTVERVDPVRERRARLRVAALRGVPAAPAPAPAPARRADPLAPPAIASAPSRSGPVILDLTRTQRINLDLRRGSYQ